MRSFKQVLVWLRRFRYRCGYGVHSPFAFDFITNVIYEKTSYYAYREIENKTRSISPKVPRLLFRLVNRVQPQIIIDAGKESVTSDYLRAAKRKAGYVSLTPENTTALTSISKVDFLYINRPEDVAFVEKLLEHGIKNTTNRSMIVIQGIYHSATMKTIWKQVVADERVGVTFDLYDLGILFFDHSKIKQHYVVNF